MENGKGVMAIPAGGLPIDFRQALSFMAAPATAWAQRRNAVLDGLFYDVDDLTETERNALLEEDNKEGSILVVWPTGAKGDMGIRKFADHAELVAAPGRTLSRFAIAGVGSSDLGAAAFARTAADRYGEPVGAIVAGYGLSDLLQEALGGWFVLGGANRMMKAFHEVTGETASLVEEFSAVTGRGAVKPDTVIPDPKKMAEPLTGRTDSETLFRLLLDEHRTIVSVAGHSKGCLSVAFALEALALSGVEDAIERSRAMRITTASTVVELPDGYENVGQYIGSIDGFGAMNSRFRVPRELVPGAWHHLNTRLPCHLDFAAVLAHEPD